MPTFLYCCPISGMNVQGWVADKPAEGDDVYVTMACYACRRTHMVNPKTGKVLGEEGDGPNEIPTAGN